MVLDVAALLDPAAGLVREVVVTPPARDGVPLWKCAARLACAHEHRTTSQDPLDPCTAGACSTSRAPAVVRTAGEAVERMGLHGRGGPAATVAGLDGQALPYWDHGLGAVPGGRPLRWYPATRLADGSSWWVPAGLVEYPGDPGDGDGFDRGPSGAASGLGREPALRAALLETVERDAVIVAWARQLRLGAVDVDAALAGASWDAEWSLLARSVALARGGGLEPVFARVPLGIDGLVCVVGGVRGVGRHHPVLALGAKVSEHPAKALSAALHESFQLFPVLLQLESPDEHDGATATEWQRMRYLASATGSRALERWLCDPIVSPYPAGPAGPPGDLDALTRRLLADGLDAHVVDLTDELPAAVRSRGWSVVKVVPVGYQPLRVDERTVFGWHRGRLGSVEARTGADARVGVDDLSPLPHPLP